MKRVGTLLFTLSLILLAACPVSASDNHQKALISAVKTDSTTEFIQIYNLTDTSLVLDNWRLHYTEVSGSTSSYATCRLLDWAPLKSNLGLSGVINPAGTVSFKISMKDDTSAALRLVENNGSNDVVQDVVGWGSSGAPAYCAENSSAPIAGSLKYIARCTVDNIPQDTNDNGIDFSEVSYSQSQGIILPACPEGANDDQENPSTPPVHQGACEGLIISEIGANLNSSEQFVEVYNSKTGSMNLEGCKIMTNRSNTNAHVFSNEELASETYKTILIKDTPLTLTKTTSGTVYVLSSDNTEVDSRYYENLKENTSWSWFGGDGWKQTYQMTPGALNLFQEFVACPIGQERNLETGRCRNSESETTQASCPAGKFRNPATNRCKNIASAPSALKGCAADQFRNPETNRCKKIASASSTLTPCKPGQERNPETNRCRKIGADSKTPKPCQPGQERNPDTNRCRKIKAANSTLGAPAAINPISMNSRIVSLLIAMAAGYAAFEYKTDIKNWLNRLRNKRGDPRPPG